MLKKQHFTGKGGKKILFLTQFQELNTKQGIQTLFPLCVTCVAMLF